LSSFGEQLAAALAPDVAFAPPHAVRFLAREALVGLKSDLVPASDDPAVATALSFTLDRTLSDLRGAGTTVAHLREEGSPRACVLADIWEHVDDALLRAGLADPRTALRALTERLRGERSEEILAAVAASITVTGMIGLTREELTMLEAVHTASRRGGGGGIRLELPRLSSLLAAASGDAVARVADELERRWGALEDPPEIEWCPTSGGAPDAVIVARTADGEARAVASHIAGALSRGTPLDRIAIVVPSLDDTYLEPLRSRLDDSRIPFVEPRGRTVVRAPATQLALSILALAEGPVRRDQLIDLLRAPGLSPSLWLEATEQSDAAARLLSLAHRLGELPVESDDTGQQLIRALEKHSARAPDDAWMPSALGHLVRELRSLAEGEPNAGPKPPALPTLVQRFLALIRRLRLGATPSDALEMALRADEADEPRQGTLTLRAHAERAAALRALQGTCRAFVTAALSVGLSDRPTSPKQLAAELELALRELGDGLCAGRGPARAAAVRIATPVDLAGLEHDLVLVTGLGAGAYGGPPAASELLDERVRKSLPASCRPPSPAERHATAQAELAWTLAGSSHVVLTYSATDGDEEVAPHDLVRWGLSLVERPQEEPASRVASTASCPDARSAELAALAAGAPPQGDLAARVAIERGRAAFFLDPRAPADLHNGRIALADPAATHDFFAAIGGASPDRPIAVTAIDRAAACPFAGFAYRVLAVRRIEEQAEAADGRDRGLMVHRALRAAFDAIRLVGATGDRDALLAVARKAADDELDVLSPMAPLRRVAVTDAVADTLAVVAQTLASETPMRCVATEQRFGARSPTSWRALELSGDDGPVVFVEGQIDRVDVAGDGARARVVDYKTGKRPARDDHGKTAFQLALYAAVVARELRVSDVEAVYVSVSSRGLVDTSPKADEGRLALGAQRGEAIDAARRVVLGLWRGEVPPRPATAATCASCDARDVCRRPAIAPIEEP
jgi:RecB family exonuclease